MSRSYLDRYVPVTRGAVGLQAPLASRDKKKTEQWQRSKENLFS